MRPVKKILCAIDFFEYSPLVAEYARAAALAFGAELFVLHAVAPIPPGGAGSDFDIPPSQLRTMEDDFWASADNRMKEFIEKNFQGLTVKGVVVIGDPAGQILAQAEEIGADMVIMGTRGHKGLDRLFFGSVATKVVKSSPVPVLTIRPPYEISGA